jgi:hypothetical protein
VSNSLWLSYITRLFNISLEYLAGEHGKVGHGGEGADEDGSKVVPATTRVSLGKSLVLVLRAQDHGLERAAVLQYGRQGAYFLVALALPAREMKMIVDTERIRKVMVRAPTPVEPTSSIVVHADGARLSVIHHNLSYRQLLLTPPNHWYPPHPDRVNHKLHCHMAHVLPMHAFLSSTPVLAPCQH